MKSLILNKNKWEKLDNLFITGFAWKGNQKLDIHEISGLIAGCQSFKNFSELISEFNGQFSLIYQTENLCWLAVDKTRTYPLFIKEQHSVSDDWFSLFESNTSFNQEQALSLITFGHTQGQKTLCEEIIDIPAGQTAEYLKGNWSFFKYHSYLKENRRSSNFQSNQNELLSILENVCKRMVENLGDRPVVLPLSGGFDSRLIATWLKDNNINNVHCFTYGRKENNFEWKVSKAVAKQLGYKWQMIDYEDPKHLNTFCSDEFFTYAKYVGQGTSMSYMQEYFAVKELHSAGELEPNSVFLPGHSLDALAGGHQSESLEKHADLESISRVIYENYGSGPELSKTEQNSILKVVDENIHSYKGNLPNSILEEWDFKNRQPKLIINSAQLYRYFSYDFLIPLWDDELIRFFQPLSYEETRGCHLYHNTLTKKVFGKSLSFDSDTASIVRKNPKWKSLLRKKIPSSIVEKRIRKKEILNYQNFTKPLILELNSKGTMYHPPRYSYNNIISEWYLSRLF
jgi:asparagine synthase (glutamine-hydrolysing)